VPRPLKILFFVDRWGFLRPYESLIALLAERGHEIHIAFGALPAGELNLVERVARSSPRVSYDVAPGRDAGDGWRSVAWLVRGVADLARYSHPRYEHAAVLRRRMTKKVLRNLATPNGFAPIGRRVALRVARRLTSTTDAKLSTRVIARAARLENAIPTSARIDAYIREHAPDVVLLTPAVKVASSQVEYLKSARRLGIPTGIGVASWDNLTNKGLLKFVPERVFVWNEVQRREAVELHGLPQERVVVTGAQLFDEWFERRPSRSRAEFMREVGLDANEPYVLYLCSSPFVTNHSDDEVQFVTRWIEALRSSDDERLQRLGVLVRPHPVGNLWRRVDLARFENAVVWPASPKRPVADAARADFFDSLVHSAAVVGINTTAMIEAAIVGKSVLSVLAPEFAQESTLHFHYLLEQNGGFLHVASALDEHLEQLRGALDDDPSGAERRRRFVESFVRPRGLDRPATPILADAVERLAQVSVADRAPLASRLLRVPLTFEAVLSARSARDR
jgi:hypothetical protein